MKTPCEMKKNAEVPVRKELPTVAAPILSIEKETFTGKSIRNLIRLIKGIMKEDKEYSISLTVRSYEN